MIQGSYNIKQKWSIFWTEEFWRIFVYNRQRAVEVEKIGHLIHIRIAVQ